jgi:hypothetical protein
VTPNAAPCINNVDTSGEMEQDVATMPALGMATI